MRGEVEVTFDEPRSSVRTTVGLAGAGLVVALGMLVMAWRRRRA
jgi:hypothetical protein